MPDSNFNTGIQQLLTRAITLIPTANPKELYEISVCLRAIGKTEDTTAETAFANRINTLLQASLGTTNKQYIARTIGNMLEKDFVDGVDLPSQTNNNNKLLSTNGLSLSWVKTALDDITNVNIPSPSSGDTLSWDINAGDLVTATAPTRSFETYANVAGLPGSDTTGKIAYAIAEDSFHYWDGSAWNEITTGVAGQTWTLLKTITTAPSSSYNTLAYSSDETWSSVSKRYWKFEIHSTVSDNDVQFGEFKLKSSGGYNSWNSSATSVAYRTDTGATVSWTGGEGIDKGFDNNNTGTKAFRGLDAFGGSSATANVTIIVDNTTNITTTGFNYYTANDMSGRSPDHIKIYYSDTSAAFN